MPLESRDLSSFPHYVLEPDRMLHRACRRELGPWWFCSIEHHKDLEPSCRFDLHEPAGTCYLATHPGIALLERLHRDFDGLPLAIESDYLRRKVLLHEMSVPEAITVADLTHPRATGYDIDLSTFASSPPHLVPQSVAAQLHASGFAGLSYLPRVDPSGQERSVAVFDDAGQHEWGTRALEIDDEIIAYLVEHCSIPVVESPEAAALWILPPADPTP